MVKQRKKVVSKAIKKKWFVISAPQIFHEQDLAECPANDLKSLIGKTVKVNLMTLTRDPKRQGISLTFQAVTIKGDKATTEITGYNILPSSIKKMVRRNKNRIDGSYKVKTSDGYIVQIKPFLLTRTLAKGSVVKALRKIQMNLLASFIGKMTYEKLVKDTIDHRIQKTMYKSLQKTYPVSHFELRTLKMISRPEKKNANTKD